MAADTVSVTTSAGCGCWQQVPRGNGDNLKAALPFFYRLRVPNVKELKQLCISRVRSHAGEKATSASSSCLSWTPTSTAPSLTFSRRKLPRSCRGNGPRWDTFASKMRSTEPCKGAVLGRLVLLLWGGCVGSFVR